MTMVGSLRQRVLKEAAAWHARMLEPASEHEVAEFEAWLASGRDHAQAYAEMEAISGAAPTLRSALDTSSRQVVPSRGLRPALAFAALAVIFAAGLWLWQGAASPAYAAVTNPGAGVRGVRLGDGTAVWLDAGAEIDVSLDGPTRRIIVRKGRVRISPGRDPKPVEIVAGRFRIYPRLARLDVTVAGERAALATLEGAISVSSPHEQGFTLTQGQAVSIDSGGRHAAALDRSWPASRLRFEDATLGRIAALANRLGDPDIVFADPEIAALPVTGILDVRDTRKLARKLAAAFDLEVVEERSQLVLRR